MNLKESFGKKKIVLKSVARKDYVRILQSDLNTKSNPIIAN